MGISAIADSADINDSAAALALWATSAANDRLPVSADMIPPWFENAPVSTTLQAVNTLYESKNVVEPFDTMALLSLQTLLKYLCLNEQRNFGGLSSGGKNPEFKTRKSEWQISK